MQLFTPYEYVLIALANEYGLDKLEWNKRIEWAKDNKQTILNNFEIMLPEASKPMAFAKAALALRDIHKGKETNYIMGLDATSSGKLLPL